MSAFAVWIETDNAAFHIDPRADDHERSDEIEVREVSRILRELADRIEERRELRVADLNGNTVGDAIFLDDGETFGREA